MRNAGTWLGRAVPQRSLPPCGGGTGRGVQPALHLFVIAGPTNGGSNVLATWVFAPEYLRARRLIATPLPVPPPQGGRERCGTHLRNSRNVPAEPLFQRQK